MNKQKYIIKAKEKQIAGWQNTDETEEKGIIRQRNIKIAKENRNIVLQGYYEKQGERIPLFPQYPWEEQKENMQSSRVFFPDDLKQLSNKKKDLFRKKDSRLYVVNGDTFSVAQALPGRTVSLNFANPFHPGGGYKRGASAQEEDLCRRSTLYASLSGQEAKKAYAFQKKRSEIIYENCLILSEYVAIFRDRDYRLMRSPVQTSVITAAAPNRRKEAGAVAKDALKVIFKKRIREVLLVAATAGYQNLVLGAWGCGAFGNDPFMVAESFYEVLITEDMRKHFDQVIFAIPELREGKNLAAFAQVFEHERCGPLPVALRMALEHGGWQADSYGNMYNGRMKDGKREGYGRLKYNDGGFYEGEFLDDMEEGYGRKIFEDGNVYVGQISAGTAHGMGRITYNNGVTKHGIFEQNWMVEERDREKIQKMLEKKGLF